MDDGSDTKITILQYTVLSFFKDRIHVNGPVK